VSWFRLDQYDAAAIESLSASFVEAQPFPHVVLDDVLAATPDDILPSFPEPDWPGWQRYDVAYQPGKMFCQQIEIIPEPLAAIIHELSSPAFLAFVESVTGIASLVPDPYLEGAGLHCSGPGGVLAPHTDFHLYDRLDLFRQVNVLLYLNDDWPEDAGGGLELWKKGSDHPHTVIAPTFGRCVIFRTDDRSVHGFTQPVQAGWRRSIALYYYTARDLSHFGGDNNVYWRHHGEHRFVGRVQLAAYRALLKGSRAFSLWAHHVNPNVRATRTRKPGETER
jgi:hypothetical protein